MYIDGNRIGWGITDDDGFWNITFGKPIKTGDYVLRFNQFVNEKIISSIDTPVSQPDYSVIEAIDENTVVVQPGNSLWRISRRFSSTSSKLPPISRIIWSCYIIISIIICRNFLEIA